MPIAPKLAISSSRRAEARKSNP